MNDALRLAQLERAKREREKRQEAKPPEADMSVWGRIKDNIVGVDDGVMSAGEKLGSFLNLGGEAMTLGLVGDETSATVESLLPGVDYQSRRDHYRDQQKQFKEENPKTALAAEIGGGVLGALLPGGAIGNIAKGGRALKAAASTAAGAGMGATYGFAEGEGSQGRMDGLASGAFLGAGAGLAAPAVGAGAKRIVDALLQRAPKQAALRAAQSAASQRAGSRQQYRAFENADAQIGPEAMERLQKQVGQRIDDAGAPNIPGPLGRKPRAGRDINKTLAAMLTEADAAQTVANAADEAARRPRQAGPHLAIEGPPKIGDRPGQFGIPLKAIEDVRREAGILGREVDNAFRPTRNANIANQAVNEIDQFIDNLQPGDMVAGDADAAISALKKARSMWRSSIKTQLLENATDEADNYLGGTASGLRNQVKSLLRKNKKTKLFTKQEEEALKKVIGNTAIGRTVRLVGDGLGQKVATLGGGAVGGPIGAMAGRGLSEVASNLNDSLASRQMEIAKALVANGKLQNLPQLSDARRQLIEQLARRTGVVQSH